MADNGTFLFGPVDGEYRRTWAWATLILVPLFLLSGQILFLLPAKLLGYLTAENVETYPYVLNLIIGAFAAAACIFISVLMLPRFNSTDMHAQRQRDIS